MSLNMQRKKIKIENIGVEIEIEAAESHDWPTWRPPATEFPERSFAPPNLILLENQNVWENQNVTISLNGSKILRKNLEI